MISGFDEATCAQIASQLQGLTMKEVGAYINAMESRYPELKRRLMLALGGYGAEAAVSPLGLAVRKEWFQLLRLGRCFAVNGSVGATTAQFPMVELVSGGPSVRNLLVFMVLAGSTTTQRLSVIRDVVSITGGSTTLQGLGPVTDPGRQATCFQGTSAAAVLAPFIRPRVQSGVELQLQSPDGGPLFEIVSGLLRVEGEMVNTDLDVTFVAAEIDNSGANKYP